MLLAHIREGFIRSNQRSFSSSGALAPGESAVFGGMRGYSVWWPSVPSTLDCNDVLCAAPVCQVGIGAGLGVAVPFRTPGISILAGYMR